jgi:hypothetical protein
MSSKLSCIISVLHYNTNYNPGSKCVRHHDQGVRPVQIFLIGCAFLGKEGCK